VLRLEGSARRAPHERGDRARATKQAKAQIEELTLQELRRKLDIAQVDAARRT
jgi:hypothetical protein